MLTKTIRVYEEPKEYEYQKTESLESFCHHVKNSLEDYYGDTAKVTLHHVNKNNGVILNGITILLKKNAKQIAPTIYLEDLFESYQKGIPYHKIIEKVIEIYDEEEVINGFDVEFFADYDKVKKKLMYKLVHYEMNRELLEDVPYFRFLDLAGICYCNVINDVIGNGSVLIHRNHLKDWKVDEETLIKDARENMPRIFPIEWKSMNQLMEEMLQIEKGDEEWDLEKINMYVLTNRNRLNGASSILYDNILSGIGESLGGDFYILPSSVHEVIIVPKSEGIDEDYLTQMVQDVNSTQLEQEEILSNHAYLYSCFQNKVLCLPFIPE